MTGIRDGLVRVAMAGAFVTQTNDNFQHLARTIASDTGRTMDDSVPLKVQKASFAHAKTQLNAADVAINTALDRIRAGPRAHSRRFTKTWFPAFGREGIECPTCRVEIEVILHLDQKNARWKYERGKNATQVFEEDGVVAVRTFYQGIMVPDREGEQVSPFVETILKVGNLERFRDDET